MNIENIRPSFVVYYVDVLEDRKSLVSIALRDYGFSVESFSSVTDAEEKLTSEPPHLIFVTYESIKVKGVTSIEYFQNKSPETRIVVLASEKNFTEVHQNYSIRVFDLIFSDFFQVNETVKSRNSTMARLLKVADHCVEMDFYKYQSEQIKEEFREEASGQTSQSAFIFQNLWLRQLAGCQNVTDTIDCFLKEASRYLSGTPILYLKNIRAYNSFVASRSINFAGFKPGVKIATNLEALRVQESGDSNVESELENNLKKEYGWDEVSLMPLITTGSFRGYFVFKASKETRSDPYLMSCLNSLTLKLGTVFLARKLHSLDHYDQATGLYSRKYLMNRLNDEIVRSRRIYIPVSILMVGIDNFSAALENTNKEGVERAIKLIATLLSKTSRINDIVGRISGDEFAIILPHTPYRGALIKAERVRQFIENARFSDVVAGISKLTISVGVAEYPSHCSDVNEMLKSADEAMFDVSKAGGNQVCLTTAPENFVPDFTYKA